MIDYFLRDQEIRNIKINKALRNLRQSLRQSLIKSTFGEEIFQDYARESFYGLSIWIPKYEQTYRLRKEEMRSVLYKELLPQSLRQFLF